MIRNLLSATASGLITFAYLLFYNVTKFTDPVPAYLLAGVIAAAGALIWPIVVGWLLARRARDRRDEEIQKEVDRQLAEKGK